MTRFKCRKTGQILGIVYPHMSSWEVRIDKMTVWRPDWTREEAEAWLEQELERETNV